MITVTIAINAQVVYARSAVNITKTKCGCDGEPQMYRLDTGQLVEHPFGDILGLTHKLIDTIEVT